MATEKKQSFFGGAAVLAAGVVIVKIIGALFKIPLANILSETGNADFNNAYNIYAVLLTISTAGLPVALSKMISEAKTLGRERQARRVLKVSFAAFLTLGVLSFVIMWFGNESARRFSITRTPPTVSRRLPRALCASAALPHSAALRRGASA
ncbi:MAG: oligosaccharide flippase family protein [Oscillibacter sp.]